MEFSIVRQGEQGAALTDISPPHTTRPLASTANPLSVKNSLADRRDDRISRYLDCLIGLYGAAASQGVGFAQRHTHTEERAVAEGLRREQFAEDDALFQRQFKLFQIRRHIGLGTAVDEAHPLHA